MPNPRNIDTGYPRPDEGARVLPWANTTADKLNRSNISLGGLRDKPINSAMGRYFLDSANPPNITRPEASDQSSFNWAIVNDSGTAKVIIGTGWVEHHEPDGSTEYYEAAQQTDIALSAGYNVIYVNYTIKTSAAISATVSNAATETLALGGVDDTTTILRIPLGCWRHYSATVHGNSKTVIKLIRKYHTGNVKIFPIFAG